MPQNPIYKSLKRERTEMRRRRNQVNRDERTELARIVRERAKLDQAEKVCRQNCSRARKQIERRINVLDGRLSAAA